MSENNVTSFFSSQDAPWERQIARVLLWFLYVGMAFLVIMMVLTVVHALGRYFLGQPIPGLVEMSSFMLVIIIFLAAAYTEVVKGHIVIGIAVDRLSERTQAIIDSITYVLSLVLASVALWQSVVRGILIMEVGKVTSVLAIPHFPFIYVLAFGWVILGLAILLHLIHFVARAVRRARQ